MCRVYRTCVWKGCSRFAWDNGYKGCAWCLGEGSCRCVDVFNSGSAQRIYILATAAGSIVYRHLVFMLFMCLFSH